MRVLRTLAELRTAVAGARTRGPVGFAPTMGALHAGHASLFTAARADGGTVLGSVFVNPTQFAHGEDFSRYPRQPDADATLAAESGVDLLWFPAQEALYPEGEVTRVTVGALGERLCGAFRPGHFDGVATVVVKLLHATMPDALYLGEKDFQQTVVLRRVLADLLLPVEVRTVPTVRDPDGLAMSSRNVYLSAEERAIALAIPRALEAASALAKGGERSGPAIEAAMQEVLRAADGLTVEYAELVHPATLDRIDTLDGHARACIAARVGATRLIDNRRIEA